jgi:hypothetical protein
VAEHTAGVFVPLEAALGPPEAALVPPEEQPMVTPATSTAAKRRVKDARAWMHGDRRGRDRRCPGLDESPHERGRAQWAAVDARRSIPGGIDA